MEQMLFRPIGPDDYGKVRKLLIEVGWQKRVEDPNRFERMIVGASRTMVALAGDRVVGFARALFDGASNGYISTVAVAEGKQRQGIGEEMVKWLMDVEDGEKITWVLRAGRGTEGFWENMGFTKSEIAMEILRRE